MRQKECISYIVKDDCGYAPNPWWGECTLAVCKPLIRRTAQEGDLIVGLTPRPLGNEIVYAMYINEILTLGEYYKDPRFESKKPDFQSEDVRKWMGDNFYEPYGSDFIQHISAHNVLNRSDLILEKKKIADLSGANVLISDLFFYYGSNSKPLPEELDFLRIGRGHRLSGTNGVLAFERHAGNLLETPGVCGDPRTLSQELPGLRHLHDLSVQ
jgi:hypothetical protein